MNVAASHAVNLPLSLTSFVGRRREVAEIRRRLGVTRLLTLTGHGGVGKTRLALEAAATASKAFPDGVWLVELAAVRDPSTVASATANALGVPDVGARSVLHQLAGHLAERQALIVLDNCEHLVAACAHAAVALLSAAPGLRVLATSRQPLGVAGEHVFGVAPLPPEDAADLLRDRAAAIGAQSRVGDADRDGVDRLCADLDRLPLAIELAAVRLRTLTVAQVTERLEDRFTLLRDGGHAAQQRHRTLRAVMDSSYELCAPAERLLWNRLSVCADGFALDAAEQVCADDGIAGHEVLDLLDRLVVQSVVLPVETEGQLRYRLLETVRQYGRERLTESGEAPRVLRRHRDFLLALAERTAADWFGPGQEAALARLRAEHGNLRAVLDCGPHVPEADGRDERWGRDDVQAALALAAALRFHWCVGGFLTEGRRHFDRLLAAAPEPTAARAWALWAAAWVALLQGDYAAAGDWLAQADELGGRLGDPLVRAYVEGLRGTSANFRGRFREAASRFESALAATRASGGGRAELLWLFQLTIAQVLLGDPRAARTGGQALAFARAHGERVCQSYVLWALACEAAVRGELEASTGMARAALEIQQGFSDYVGTVLPLDLLAWIAAARGDHERAGQLLGAVDTLARDAGINLRHVTFHDNRARCEDTITAALGRAGFEQALRRGARHDSPGRAIAFALSDGTGPEPASGPAADDPLTRREREVAARVADGMTNRQIASALRRSPRTVDTHVKNILAKLGFASRAQIAAWWTANQEPRA